MLLHRISEAVIIASLAVGGVAVNTTCYYPNGSRNSGGACNANAEVSSCCGPTFVCLSNGLCQPGPDSQRTYAYNFYRSGCTDATFNSTSCPRFCIGSGYHNDRGHGVKSCGNDTYCCGASGDCCSDSANIFALESAETVTTISASSAYITSAANDTSASSLAPGVDHHALAIGLGVGIGVGGFLLIALAVLYVLKRRAKSKRSVEFEKDEEVSELDAEWKAELPDSTTAPAPTKTCHTAPGNGVIHELAEGRTGPSTPPQELEANTTYDWEPRNEPEPRDGGYRPTEPSGHRAPE
ncbi:hypothetical protein OPT61_g4091 [Boeremia exigua]|uniref:Uncharacterized protein n=1 Tax=Boeremia exigua TaxID=749465 RepID=A0ACC2IFD5_9PLEO|nr:hypothetical protein OPT61_g4091 [Boeremia exigua]